MNIVILAVVAGAGALLLWLGRKLIAQGRGSFVSRNAKYQATSVLVAVGVLGLSWAFSGNNPMSWFVVGDLGAPISDMGWLGVSESDTWGTIGTTFLVVMTIVTGTVLWFQVGRAGGVTFNGIVRVFPVVLLVSVVNTLVEESIFRVSLVNALDGSWVATSIAVASAVLFGIPHYFGRPGAIAGVAMAGFMGWFLTLSIIHTGGIGWALFIHFVQDIVILSMVFASNKSSNQTR